MAPTLQTIMDNGLLNKGGTILFDNALFFGQVYSDDRSNETTPFGCGVRECLDFIKEDPRVQRVNEISWRDILTSMLQDCLYNGCWCIIM